MTSAPGGLRVDVLFEHAYQPDPRVRRIARALVDAGYRVRVLAWDRTGLLPAQERDGDVLIRRVTVKSYDGRGWRQIFFLARAVWRYLPLMRSDRPDIVHAVDLPMLVAALLLGPFVGRPRIVFDAFEIYSIMESRKYPRWALRSIGFLERLLPRLADVVLTVGEGRQQWFRERGVRSTVVANWIDPPATSLTRLEARAALGLPADAFVILYAGGINPSRQIDALIGHAARQPGDIVLIAGSGSDEARLRALAHDLPNVRFLGFVADPTPVTLAADALYYSLVDHPYAQHAAPNNLYMAISHTVPLIHRSQGEIGVLARRSMIGREFEDAASLDRAIDALRDPGLSATIRTELRKLQEVYSWRNAREALLRVYPNHGSTARRPSAKGP